MFSDKVAGKLLKLNSSKGIIREAVKEEMGKLVRSAKDGDELALKTIASILTEKADFESLSDINAFTEGLTNRYMETLQTGAGKEAAKKKKKSKLREVEERILHFCTKPRVSSSVIELFPARPFNVLAIMENLRHKGMLLLAANHWVTNIENRDFVPTMVMTAEKKAGQFESKTAEMWSYSDVESKKRLLARAKIKATEKYASEEWDFLPTWVKKSVSYVHENPAISIAEKKEAETKCEVCGKGLSYGKERKVTDPPNCGDHKKDENKKDSKEADEQGDGLKFEYETTVPEGEGTCQTCGGMGGYHDKGCKDDSKKEAETGEVKKDFPMEITQIQDIDTGEKITDSKLISEGVNAGLEYIVSFKREGKEETALLSSLDKSKLKLAEPNSLVGKVSPKDILEMVYDKLMENNQHEKLDVEHVEDPELDLGSSTISFKYYGVPVKFSMGTNY